MWFIIIAVIAALASALYFFLEKKTVYKDLKGKHVVVTGGSSGIGKAAAVEAARLGAHVTIIGRDVNKLNAAVSEISSQAKDGQKIQHVSLDVTSDCNLIQKSFTTLERDIGPIFMLINAAGKCICGQFETMNVQDIKEMIDLNYFGSAYPTHYVLSGMKKRNEGLIVLVSSEASLIGIYGYSAYSAGKWAVRGLAEAIFMELVGTNVRLTLAFPPDTDTPGFAQEELSKPKETKLISASSGLSSAEYVGKKIVHDSMNGKLYSVFGLSGNLLTTLYCGAVESVSQVLLQVFTMGLLRAILVPVMLSFDNIVRNGLKERENETLKNK